MKEKEATKVSLPSTQTTFKTLLFLYETAIVFNL